MVERFIACGFALVLLTACGGRIVGDAEATSTSTEQTMDDPSFGAGPADGPWGLWQLLSVDGPNGQRQYDPPFVELDVHPDGTAFRWTCPAAATGNGLPCAAPLRQGCLAGTVGLEGLKWRVHIRGSEGSNGEVEDEPSGDIHVNGAHYRRVAAPSAFGCIP